MINSQCACCVAIAIEYLSRGFVAHPICFAIARRPFAMRRCVGSAPRSRDVDHREPPGRNRVPRFARTLGSETCIARGWRAERPRSAGHARAWCMRFQTGGGGRRAPVAGGDSRRAAGVVAARVVATEARVVATGVEAGASRPVVEAGVVEAGVVEAGVVEAGVVEARVIASAWSRPASRPGRRGPYLKAESSPVWSRPASRPVSSRPTSRPVSSRPTSRPVPSRQGRRGPWYRVRVVATCVATCVAAGASSPCDRDRRRGPCRRHGRRGRVVAARVVATGVEARIVAAGSSRPVWSQPASRPVSSRRGRRGPCGRDQRRGPYRRGGVAVPVWSPPASRPGRRGRARRGPCHRVRVLATGVEAVSSRRGRRGPCGRDQRRGPYRRGGVAVPVWSPPASKPGRRGRARRGPYRRGGVGRGRSSCPAHLARQGELRQGANTSGVRNVRPLVTWNAPRSDATSRAPASTYTPIAYVPRNTPRGSTPTPLT
jgi:hypothetical protein